MNIWFSVFLVIFVAVAIPPFCYSIALSPESKKKIPLKNIYIPMGLASGIMTLLIVLSLHFMTSARENINKKCEEKGGVILPYSRSPNLMCVTPEALNSLKKGIIEIDD